MLKTFKISNFKIFKDEFVLDLTSGNYKFNNECVDNSIVKKAAIYGKNGVGKSNLGFAIFDIIKHITDQYINKDYYTSYQNADNKSSVVSFYYEFDFSGDSVKYIYQKESHEELLNEQLFINDALVIDYNGVSFDTALKGAENLHNDLEHSDISSIKYIKKNTVLEDDKTNKIFNMFYDFVDKMLFFRSLTQNMFLGHLATGGSLSKDIIENNNLKKFEKFLNDAGIDCELITQEIDGQNIIYWKKEHSSFEFFRSASSGTRSLTLFFCWLEKLKKISHPTLVFIDEFDAFYHFELSEFVVKKLLDINHQVIVTTHNTSIMTNELLRPDCYFIMNEKNIKSLPNAAIKDIREGHNIEKMFRAGSFNV